MAKFTFRLQKVLEHRARLEEAAKNAFHDKRVEVLETEVTIRGIGARRDATLGQVRPTLTDLQALESELRNLDDEERAQRVILGVLTDEEARLRTDWITSKQELEAVLKLREHAMTEWQAEENRQEQNALDEWGTFRRIAS